MNKVPQTICPFCNLGCQLGFEMKGRDVKCVEYISSARNEGRLCPKGNMAAAFYNHRKRLYHPIIQSKPVSVKEGIEHLRTRLSEFKPEEVLLVYDASLTSEETASLAGWAAESGYKNLAYAAEASTSAFLYGKRKPLIVEQITTGEYAFIIGDAFRQDSVISGYIGKAKGDNKKFKYIIVDSIETNTSRFAHQFVKPKPGYESLFLYGLYKHISGEKVDLTALGETISVEKTVFEKIASLIRNRDGILIYAPAPGRSFDPILAHTSALKLSQFNEGMVYVPLGERIPLKAAKPFFSYLGDLSDKKIKAVVGFGHHFPWQFPQLKNILRKKEFVACGSMFYPKGRFDMEIVLPLASELEKEGTVTNLFGKERLTGSLPAISGTLTSGELISALGPGKSNDSLPEMFDLPGDEDLDKRAKALMEFKPNRIKGANLLLIGSKSAVGFEGIYEKEDWIRINSDEAKFLKVKEGDKVGIESGEGEGELDVKVSLDVPDEVAEISANNMISRSLFELAVDADTGEGILKPTWSKVWKK